MFWGSIFGMAIGIFFGAENGRCCGIMGVMEGIMAGFMGGLMGAMTAVMMFNDHLKAAGVIVFIISGVMMFGFNFMIYKETKGVDRRNEGSDFSTGMWSVLLTVLTIFMMVFGPRSVLLQ
jgi:heme/copper-type cytochrome/quinol oxidase subunit 3